MKNGTESGKLELLVVQKHAVGWITSELGRNQQARLQTAGRVPASQHLAIDELQENAALGLSSAQRAHVQEVVGLGTRVAGRRLKHGGRR